MNVPFAFTILTVSGLFLIGVLIFVLARFRNQLKNGLRVAGTLVDYEVKTSSRGQTNYYPIVEFKTVLGEMTKGSSMYGASNKKFDENTEVVIVYQPEYPKKFFVEGQNPTAFAYIGILLFVSTYTYMVYSLYKRDPDFFHGLLHF